MAISMLDEAALSFLGMGVQPPMASLGNMLNGAAVYHGIDFTAVAVASTGNYDRCVGSFHQLCWRCIA